MIDSEMTESRNLNDNDSDSDREVVFFSTLYPSLISNRCKAIENWIGSTPSCGSSLESPDSLWTDLGHVLTYESVTLQILQMGLDLGYIHMSGVLMEHGLKAGINVLPKKLRDCSNNNGEVILFW